MLIDKQEGLGTIYRERLLCILRSFTQNVEANGYINSFVLQSFRLRVCVPFTISQCAAWLLGTLAYLIDDLAATWIRLRNGSFTRWPFSSSFADSLHVCSYEATSQACTQAVIDEDLTKDDLTCLLTFRYGLPLAASSQVPSHLEDLMQALVDVRAQVKQVRGCCTNSTCMETIEMTASVAEAQTLVLQ